MQSSDAIFEARRHGTGLQNHGIIYPPAIATMIRNGSAPFATASGSGASGDSWEQIFAGTQKNGPLAGEPASHDHALSRAASDISLQPRPAAALSQRS